MAIQRPQLASARRERRSYSAATQLGVGRNTGGAGRSCSAVDMSRELVSGVSSLRAGKASLGRSEGWSRLTSQRASTRLSAQGTGNRRPLVRHQHAPCIGQVRESRMTAHQSPVISVLIKRSHSRADVTCRICRRHMATRDFSQATPLVACSSGATAHADRDRGQDGLSEADRCRFMARVR
jgi:hypothetical protein